MAEISLSTGMVYTVRERLERGFRGRERGFVDERKDEARFCYACVACVTSSISLASWFKF